MILSILICHLNSRAALLERLQARLKPQLEKFPEVEVLIEADDGQVKTGEKRNALLKKAGGDYVCFVDDDDLVPADYCEKIIKAINTGAQRPSCIGMEGTLIRPGQPNRKFIHSMKYSSWFERDKVYYRCPNHLNPVRREIALKVGFPDKTIGEDHDYSKKLFPLLKTEVYVNGSMYEYFCK